MKKLHHLDAIFWRQFVISGQARDVCLALDLLRV